ncbi:MAG: phosphoenolpyruvate synthase [Betaproteobacteria bacterium]
MNANKYVLPFEHIRMTDVEIVGGKNASLGEMISQLSATGVRVPTGFATTAYAFREFLTTNKLSHKIDEILSTLNIEDIDALASAGSKIRNWIIDSPLPDELVSEIKIAYEKMDNNSTVSFAVRSSATAEDLPDASFAGQQESYLNVSGLSNILLKVKHVFASLYNDRAISYRVHKGFIHSNVAISVGIQRMVRSDLASSGVMFTLDTESGFKDVILITSSYGLGETIVQGAVNPDEFYVFKPSLINDHFPIVRRSLGSKLIKMIFANDLINESVKTIDVAPESRNRYSLTDDDVVQLAKFAVIIENHYSRPMDIEWGKDGLDQQIYILQARPETVKSQSDLKSEFRYQLKQGFKGNVIVTGRAIGQKIGAGPVRIVKNISEMSRVQDGDVLVADMTDPNWEPVMKKASAIITNRGGRTCHAAIIARELGVPAVVGCENATEVLKEGSFVTVSCAEGDEGKVYDGLLETIVSEVHRKVLPEIPTKIMMNIGNPQLAYDFCQIQNSGVGLARLEFIINNNIGVHPLAILQYPNIDHDLKVAVESVARAHSSPYAFYVDKLTEGIATIASAFYPKPVIVRLSDFKSNEYKKLIGGTRFEPNEENPMLGFRGASRYLSKDFEKAFEMECEALKRVRIEMGFTNVEIMIPFVRTVKQAKRVIDLLKLNGIERGKDDLKIIMMCEVPSNAILADEFLEYFDGFSIGSNDLTQLTLGLDRDSGLEVLSIDFDERDESIKYLIKRAIDACISKNKYVGICGQGPSDYPDFALWLVEQGISSISLNPDTVLETWERLI